MAFPGDASAPSYAEEVQQTVKERWGEVDLLINNAGENPNQNFFESTPEDFEQTFRINCLSAIRCIKVVLPAMIVRRAGVIVNVSSVLGKWASANSPAYSVSKYAMTGLTDSLRQELAGSGVHIMGVYPGFIRTAMTMPFVKPGSLRDRAGKSPDDMARAILLGIERRKMEVHYPAYVSLSLTLYHLFPRLLERLRKMTGH
jgi:short-subunit dehydrogenase